MILKNRSLPVHHHLSFKLQLPIAFKMLMLSILHSLLSQVLAPPYLHTAVLFTTSGELVSATSEPLRPKDEIRIVVGLSGEVWQETKEQGYGMVDSEVRFVLHLKCEHYQRPSFS